MYFGLIKKKQSLQLLFGKSKNFFHKQAENKGKLPLKFEHHFSTKQKPYSHLPLQDLSLEKEQISLPIFTLFEHYF